MRSCRGNREYEALIGAPAVDPPGDVPLELERAHVVGLPAATASRRPPQSAIPSDFASLDLDVQDRLAGFPSPTLVLAGSTTPEIMRGRAERTPGSTYHELPGTPHMQTLSRPALVAEALDGSLPSAEGREKMRP